MLPTLGPKLEGLQKEVYGGRGFTVLRGLNPNEYSAEDLTMIFMGISTYIGGRIGRQDKAGNCLVHIIADKASQAHHRHSTDQIVSYGPSATGAMLGENPTDRFPDVSHGRNGRSHRLVDTWSCCQRRELCDFVCCDRLQCSRSHAP